MKINFNLPSQEITFEINITGEKSGEKYSGVFTYKRLNLGEARRARCEKTRLMEDLRNLDEETTMLCEMISWLNQGLKNAPPWWGNPWDLYDYNVITNVFNKVLDFENNFSEQLKNIGRNVEPIAVPDADTEEPNDGLVAEDESE